MLFSVKLSDTDNSRPDSYRELSKRDSVSLCEIRNLHRGSQRLHKVTRRLLINMDQIGLALARRYFSASRDQM
jgi:hypothetical protein